MRLWPFGKRVGSGSVRLNVPATVGCVFVLHHRRLQREPDLDDVKAFAIERIAATVPEPASSAFRECIVQGLCSILEVEIAKAPPIPEVVFVGLPEAEARRLRNATHVIAIGVTEENRKPRIVLMAALAAVRVLQERTNGVVLDAITMRTLPAAGADTAAALDLEFDRHIVTYLSENERGALWITTKGLSRFGLPELEIVDADKEHSEGLQRLLRIVARSLVDAVDELPRGHEQLALPLPYSVNAGDSGIALRMGLLHRPQSHRSEAFLRITAPAGHDGSEAEWWDRARAFGLGIVHSPAENPDMLAASAKARAELPSAAARFAGWKAAGTRVLVKHGAPTTDGGVEYLWFEVQAWDERGLSCLVANEPSSKCPGLALGDEKELAPSDVFDWIAIEADGRTHGGYTNEVLTRTAQG